MTLPLTASAPLGVLPWGLSASERADLDRALRFRFHKWDLHVAGRVGILPEAISLTPALHARLVTAAETFAAILARLETRIAARPDLLARLGIPAPLWPLLAAEPPRALQLARYDFHPTPDGRWMVSEFNEDVPGGFNEAAGLPALLGGAFAGHAFAGDLRRAIVDALAPYGAIAMIYATGYSEDLQHMLILEDWLAEAGHATVRCSPAHVDAGLLGVRAAGRRVRAAVRYYPGEWFVHLPNLAAWRRAAGRLPMLNPLRRLIRQSKLLFALWREPGLLTAEEHAFVRDHAPWTAPVELAEHLPMLREARERWVLKRAFGRMGDSVVIGALVTAAAWEATLAEVARDPAPWLVQTRFGHAPLTFGVGALYPVVGTFLVNGRFAGHYSRAAPAPLLTHEAYHVATLVQDPGGDRALPADAAAEARPPSGR